ncbi:hypothetical protein HRbin37_00401 [bacterium HR37]|nr:hypothetical protein HRbin37_00401 [bacterium HR37]
MALEDIIRSLIIKKGPITFAQFMELALYHPEYGYYSSGKANIGKEGDYYTSPCVHPAFGEIISRFIVRAYEIIAPSEFTVVEMGAGKGILALDILNSLKNNSPSVYNKTNYVIVERNLCILREGEKVLKEHIHKVKFIDSLSTLDPESINGVFISNELVDSFPFHRVKFINGEMFEIFVTLDKGEFKEVLGKPSTPALRKYLESYDIEFANEQEIEINLYAGEWIQSVAKILAKGLVLTIDYGFLAPELFNPRRMKGTFLCFHKHTANENPYANIGKQDITAHVDFTNLIRAGKSCGLNTVRYLTQGQFLIDWGILDIVERYSLEDIPSYKSRMAIKNLFLPELMGDRFKVLIQEKNLTHKLRSFYPSSPFRISFQRPGDRLPD